MVAAGKAGARLPHSIKNGEEDLALMAKNGGLVRPDLRGG
jgi:hypothetical protein